MLHSAPPPLSLDTPDFSDKDFSDWPRPPPFGEKFSFFSDKIPPFWQNMPKNLIFSDKPLLDWVRPPPPLYQKNLSSLLHSPYIGHRSWPTVVCAPTSEISECVLHGAEPTSMLHSFTEIHFKNLHSEYFVLNNSFT